MGRRTTGRRKREDRRGGPSIYFFIALAAGIALLIWIALKVISTPVTP